MAEKASVPSAMPGVGDRVLFTDSRGKDHEALVTIVWGQNIYPGNVPCINLVYVSGDEARQDSCGRQVERSTSVVHKSSQPAHGNYWRMPDEAANVYVPPAQT